MRKEDDEKTKAVRKVFEEAIQYRQFLTRYADGTYELEWVEGRWQGWLLCLDPQIGAGLIAAQEAIINCVTNQREHWMSEAKRLELELSDEAADNRTNQVTRDTWRSNYHGAMEQLAKAEEELIEWRYRASNPLPTHPWRHDSWQAACGKARGEAEALRKELKAIRAIPRPRADEEEHERMTEYEKGLLHGGIELWDKINEIQPSAKS